MSPQGLAALLTLTCKYLQVLPLEGQQEEQEGEQVLVEVRVAGLELEWGL